MDSHSKIIARIKAAREDLDWSQAELSRQMGQASNTIQKIESGFIKNPEKYLPEISKVTGKSLSYFFGEETPELTQFADKARKYDAMMDLLQSGGFLNKTDNSTTSNGGKNNVNVGGNGNNVNVNPNAAKIIEEIMKKDHEEHQLILKILELEKDEKDKLFQLYDVVRKKDK